MDGTGEMTGRDICPKCGKRLRYDSSTNSRFCLSCGWDSLDQLTCARCGRDLPLTATVNETGEYLCENCGGALEPDKGDE